MNHKCLLMLLVCSLGYHLKQLVLDILSNDCTWEDRANFTITELIEALHICFTSTYFTYNNICYKQIFWHSHKLKFFSSDSRYGDGRFGTTSFNCFLQLSVCL